MLSFQVMNMYLELTQLAGPVARLVGVCARDPEGEDFASCRRVVEGRHRHVFVHRAHERTHRTPSRSRNEIKLRSNRSRKKGHDTLGSYVICIILLHQTLRADAVATAGLHRIAQRQQAHRTLIAFLERLLHKCDDVAAGC